MSSGGHSEELLRIEAKLHTELADARAAFERAKAEAARLYQVSCDFGLNDSDGRAAMLNATSIERQSLKRFSVALQRFNDFVLNYKIPRDLRCPAVL